MRTERTRLPERNLDVLRALAVAAVVVDHTVSMWTHHIGWLTMWQLGRLGVLLFFVHTALVLMSSLERQGERSDWVRTFYVRRAFRIYPLAVTAILLVLYFGLPSHVTGPGISDPTVDATLRTVSANILLIQNVVGAPNILGPLWSLPLEVQMYLVLPAAFLIARRSVALVATSIGVTAIGGLVVTYTGLPGLWRLSVLAFAPCFLAGVLSYSILRALSVQESTRKLPAWSWVPVLVLCVPLFTILRPTPATPAPGWIFCLAVGLAIPFVGELNRSWFTDAAQQICKVSYGIYLLHVPCLWLAFVFFTHWSLAAQWALYLWSLVVVPVVAYRFLESPGIRIGARLAGRPNAGREAVIAVP